jgi:hypothetical protein
VILGAILICPRWDCVLRLPDGFTIYGVMIMGECGVSRRDAEATCADLRVWQMVYRVMPPVLNLTVSSIVWVVVGIPAVVAGLLVDGRSVVAGRGGSRGSCVWIGLVFGDLARPID